MIYNQDSFRIYFRSIFAYIYVIKVLALSFYNVSLASIE